MEKLVDHVKIRVIVYDWDDPETLKQKLLEFLRGIDLKKEKIEVEIHKGKGLISSELITYSIKLEKWKHIKQFLKNLIEKLSEDEKRKIIENLDKIVDERGILYLRFDKDALVGSDKLKFVDHGEVFHITITPRIFPRKKELAIKLIKDLLTGKYKDL